MCVCTSDRVMGAYRGPSPSRPVPISHLSPLTSRPSLHPAIKTSHVGDFPRRHLSEDPIHHQPSTRPRGTGQAHNIPGRTDDCSNDQHSLSCFFLPLTVSTVWPCYQVVTARDCPDCISSHQFCVRKCGLGYTFSASSETSTQPTTACCGARTRLRGAKQCKAAGLEQAHTPGGQERSSVAEARERLGAQGPGQEVRRRRFAETWEIGPLCKANSQSEPPTHHHPTDRVSTATCRLRSQAPDYQRLLLWLRV